jgi:lon-related putative ATP-dependent protease
VAGRRGELSVEELRWTVNPETLGFSSTEELEALDGVIGQDRAVRAVSFGVDIAGPGYHVFALGPSGTGKTTMVHKFLERQAPDRPVPDDWLYVNNFEDADKPIALGMPAGKGCEFRQDMDRVVEELNTEITRTFESEEYDREQQQIQEDLQKRRQALYEELEQEAQARGFALLQGAGGVMMAPVIQGNVVTPEQFGQLPEEQRQRIESGRGELQERLRDTMRQVQQLQREARDRVRALDRQAMRNTVEHLIDELKSKYSAFQEITAFLDRASADLLDKVQAFKQQRQLEQMQQQNPVAAAMAGQQAPSFDRYRANLVVDNCDTKGAPVIIEDNPTYYNLVGRVEHQVQLGALVTNFTMIRAGALQRANGGYLILDARDVLTSPFAWEALKRSLRSRQAKIEAMGEAYRAITTRTLEPEPIPLDVKVVLIGDAMLYYLLLNLDPDFRELFKVKADFAAQMDRDSDGVREYAGFIATICREENLHHFSASGVAKVVEHGARMVGHKDKLAVRFGDVVDLLRQSSYWAGQNGHDLVQAEDVQKAIDEGIYRSNQLEERMQEMIEEGTILIDTEGAVDGQVNGISILSLGDYTFGKPSRITARTFVGNAGVVNIDRETELGGRVHNKGVLILSGYLGGRYALEVPLALSASLTFEQLYEEVEGDSASSAELYALLSSLSGYPINQELAVTGSVNQRGQVQAIGGVNEKIEGYYLICKLKGLTGNQGVIIPAANVKHLMLREEVIDAVRQGRFHVYAVSTIDEGIEILTGKEAGRLQEDGTYPEGTVNGAVQKRLRELAEKVKGFARPAAEGERRGAEPVAAGDGRLE